MSQDVSTNQGIREPLTNPPRSQPWSPEAEADKLMDELFADIDRILEGGNKLPTEPAKPEYVSLQPIEIPQITTPPSVMPLQDLPQHSSTEPPEATLVEPSETSVAPIASPPAKRSSSWSLEKVLLVAGVISLGVTLILLLTNQHKLTWPWSPNPDDASFGPNGQLSAADNQFVSYMLRSLEVIDHKTKAKQSTTQASPLGPANPQTIPAPINRPIASNQAPTVLEKVYIPIYPPQTSLAPIAPSGATRGGVTLPPPPARPSRAVASSPARRSVPLPPPPANPPLVVPSVAARPKAPAPSAAAPARTVPPSEAAPPSESQQASVSTVKHTLVGLLELGDRSAALFEVNGTTQRINVGEAIGASGWTLVSVANQEAVVRRNGEVRSVYVGQKF